MKYKRILLKISWEALWSTNWGFNFESIKKISQWIFELNKKWFEIAVVCWAWNIRRFKDNQESWIDRVKSDTLWMIATIINATVLNDFFMKLWWKWIVTAPKNFQINPIVKEYNSLTMRETLSQWKVVFCAWWTWNPYSTTDLWATLRALELKCEIIYKLTKVDWIYDKDPVKFPDAKKIEKISLKQAKDLNLNIMDHTAIALAYDNNLPIFVCKLDEINHIGNEDLKWTFVHP